MAVVLDGAEKRPVEADAYAVLLPEVDHLLVEDWAEDFLRGGGRALLPALSADEYEARRVSETRRRQEDAATVHAFGADVARAADGAVLVVAEAESGGIQRFEHLLPQTPTSADASNLPDAELTGIFDAYAAEARRLGVSMFLGPVVDMVTGANPWLAGRTMVDDHARTGAVAALYVEAAQRVGIIAAAKHFPGHPDLSGNPARDVVALTVDQDEVVRNLAPFVRVIRSGVLAVVLGPVAADSIDPGFPGPTSTVLVDLLRRELGFQGLIVSDRLDMPSTTLGRSLDDVAVAAIRSGVQLLRIPGGAAPADVAGALVAAVRDHELSRSQLARAADAVRRMADADARGNLSPGLRSVAEAECGQTAMSARRHELPRSLHRTPGEA